MILYVEYPKELEIPIKKKTPELISDFNKVAQHKVHIKKLITLFQQWTTETFCFNWNLIFISASENEIGIYLRKYT